MVERKRNAHDGVGVTMGHGGGAGCKQTLSPQHFTTNAKHRERPLAWIALLLKVVCLNLHNKHAKSYFF